MISKVHKLIKCTMEPLGTLTVARSKYFNDLYVYSSIRFPGYVYEFSCLRGKSYNCCGCKKLKKTRCITIENGAIVPGKKHPEDDHHPECRPIPEAGKAVKPVHQ